MTSMGYPYRPPSLPQPPMGKQYEITGNEVPPFLGIFRTSSRGFDFACVPWVLALKSQAGGGRRAILKSLKVEAITAAGPFAL
jgi:hypothetical protein